MREASYSTIPDVVTVLCPSVRHFIPFAPVHSAVKFPTWLLCCVLYGYHISLRSLIKLIRLYIPWHICILGSTVTNW